MSEAKGKKKPGLYKPENNAIRFERLTAKILDISKRHNLSHIGSNLSCLPVLMEIYETKRPQDLVILDNAHAHLAHLLLLYDDIIRVEGILVKWGIHCTPEAGCDALGGSLGHGLGIAIGRAIADSTRDVYVTVSDGSMMEGSNWEALRIIEDLYLSGRELNNLHIYTNFNGFSAVEKIDIVNLKVKMQTFCPLDIEFRFTQNTLEFDGVQGHYRKI